jgi:hypothetical protein
MFKTPLPADHAVLLVANTVHVLSAMTLGTSRQSRRYNSLIVIGAIADIGMR